MFYLNSLGIETGLTNRYRVRNLPFGNASWSYGSQDDEQQQLDY
jgi:hypothetical protein